MDILDYMLPLQLWQLSNELGISGSGQPIYTLVLGNQIWMLKSVKGYPWDMNTFDDKYVYQSITELDWNDPKSFKMFASESWPGANGGIVWAPRAMTPNPIVTADSSYRLHSDCSTFATQNLGGPIMTYVTGPEEMDFGNDLGVQEAVSQFYIWGAGMAQMEINRYAKGFGLVQWELWRLVAGVYVQRQVSAFNVFMQKPLPVPYFPCGVPKIV
jgi:hypothetical protein